MLLYKHLDLLHSLYQAFGLVEHFFRLANFCELLALSLSLQCLLIELSISYGADFVLYLTQVRADFPQSILEAIHASMHLQKLFIILLAQSADIVVCLLYLALVIFLEPLERAYLIRSYGIS